MEVACPSSPLFHPVLLHRWFSSRQVCRVLQDTSSYMLIHMNCHICQPQKIHLTERIGVLVLDIVKLWKRQNSLTNWRKAMVNMISTVGHTLWTSLIGLTAKVNLPYSLIFGKRINVYFWVRYGCGTLTLYYNLTELILFHSQNKLYIPHWKPKKFFNLTLDCNMELAEFKISRFITSFVHDQMLAYVVHSSYTSLCHSRCHTWVVSCFNLRPGYSCVVFCSFCKSFYITGTSEAKWRALHIWRESNGVRKLTGDVSNLQGWLAE